MTEFSPLFRLRNLSFFMCAMTIVLLLIYWADPVALKFNEFEELEILSIVSTMFVMAIFMERSVQAMLIPLRAHQRIELERAITELSLKTNTDPAALPLLENATRALKNFRIRTGQLAQWMSFVFGLLISVAGVRVLAGFVDMTAADGYQKALFSFVDILLTGGVIAGGSAAIDKIGRQISSSFNLRSSIDPPPPEATLPLADTTTPPKMQ